jgi:hypothetical protein
MKSANSCNVNWEPLSDITCSGSPYAANIPSSHYLNCLFSGSRRHIDQLRNGPVPAQQTDSDAEISTAPEPEEREEEQIQEPENGDHESPGNTALQTENNTEPKLEAADSSVRRYPSRVRQLPERYQ